MAFQYTPIFNKGDKSFFYYIVAGFCFFLFLLFNIKISKPISMYQTYYKVVKPENPLHCHFLNTTEKLPDIQGKTFFVISLHLKKLNTIE